YYTVTVRAQVDGQLTQVSFKEGQPVKKGEVLAQVDPRPFLNALHQAEGQHARDSATLATNRLDLQRYEDLAQKKLVAAQQADDQRGLVQQYEAAIRVDQAAIDAAKLNLEYARIASPIDGIAGIRNIDPGNIVHASDQTGVVLVTQLEPIAVIFSLPQDVLPQVAQYQGQGELEVVAFNRDGSAELGRGKLAVIDNAINASTATLRLKAVLPNQDHALWPNQFVKARLLLTTRAGALVVPTPAIQRGPKGTFVYVVGPGNTVAVRPVELDSTEGALALISKGLTSGEQVVVDGQNQIRPGSLVQPRSAEGAPTTSAAQAGATP
ncbi:MAG TPA: efflux RND transporter periplasmic adaptor subunit, partial [Myxococcaceae bacterium]|nr:efflux RND transporter periplasmic adaptor subunit [Myxococcaceae bacterium]